MKDHKWRSNLLWYDYIQSTKNKVIEHHKTITTIRYAPVLLPDADSFEAQTLIDFLHGHFLHHKEHFIAHMIYRFNYYFVKEITESENAVIIVKFPLAKLVEETKAFVMLVLQSMVHYYGGIVSKMVEEKPGEMYDLILEEVFTDSLQDAMLRAFYQANEAYEINYRKKLDEYSKLTCFDLGIEEKFQIDKQKNESIGVGYAKAIIKLRELEFNYSPLKKIDIIIATTRLICECVDDYWKDDLTMNKDNLIIDADQILSIFLYIVIKARIFNLKGHINFILDFGRKTIQNGQMGYYVTTVEACIIQIENMGAELLSKFREN